MTNEQKEKITNALVGFVIRVAESRTATDSELLILPEITKVLFGCYTKAINISPTVEERSQINE